MVPAGLLECSGSSSLRNGCRPTPACASATRRSGSHPPAILRCRWARSTWADDDLERLLLVACDTEFGAGGHGDVRHVGAGKDLLHRGRKADDEALRGGRVGLDLRADRLKLGADGIGEGLAEGGEVGGLDLREGLKVPGGRRREMLSSHSTEVMHGRLVNQ